jgi:hypothetical protein
VFDWRECLSFFYVPFHTAFLLICVYVLNPLGDSRAIELPEDLVEEWDSSNNTLALHEIICYPIVFVILTSLFPRSLASDISSPTTKPP